MQYCKTVSVLTLSYAPSYSPLYVGAIGGWVSAGIVGIIAIVGGGITVIVVVIKRRNKKKAVRRNQWAKPCLAVHQCIHTHTRTHTRTHARIHIYSTY